MNITSIVNYILIAGAIQGFGFNLVTLFIKKKISKPIIFLNLLVLFLSLNNLQVFLRDLNFFEFSFFLKRLRIPWYFLCTPMFYAFTVHFMGLEKKVNDFVKVSVFIFTLEIVIRIILISYVYYEFPNHNVSKILIIYTFNEEIFIAIYGLFLFIRVCFFVFGKRHKNYKILSFDDLNWLKIWIVLISIAYIFWLLIIVLWRLFSIDHYYLLQLYITIVMYWVSYQGFYRYIVVQDRVFLRRTLASNEMLISSKGYLNVNHKQDDFFNEKHRNDFDKVKNYIIKNKLYLDPLFSMEDIVVELGFSKSYISRLVNSYSNNNFSDFVNSLRVEQAKKFLSNDEFSNYTIVAIGLECGFNSKSTFYSAFKKFTSETPSSFREHN